RAAEVRSRPWREIGRKDAYAAALERDTLQGYTAFVAAYPDDPMSPRVRAIIAARREALTWRRTRITDTPPAYWSYLRRYPRGPHVPDAERRLAELQAELAPPPTFAAIAYDVPPPPPGGRAPSAPGSWCPPPPPPRRCSPAPRGPRSGWPPPPRRRRSLHSSCRSRSIGRFRPTSARRLTWRRRRRTTSFTTTSTTR